MTAVICTPDDVRLQDAMSEIIVVRRRERRGRIILAIVAGGLLLALVIVVLTARLTDTPPLSDAPRYICPTYICEAWGEQHQNAADRIWKTWDLLNPQPSKQQQPKPWQYGEREYWNEPDPPKKKKPPPRKSDVPVIIPLQAISPQLLAGAMPTAEVPTTWNTNQNEAMKDCAAQQSEAWNNLQYRACMAKAGWRFCPNCHQFGRQGGRRCDEAEADRPACWSSMVTFISPKPRPIVVDQSDLPDPAIVIRDVCKRVKCDDAIIKEYLQ